MTSIPTLPVQSPPSSMPERWRRLCERVNNILQRINGVWAFSQSAIVYTLINGSTISAAQATSIRVSAAAAVTGIILQAGTVPGQLCIVINESSNSVTFAAAATSNVADGTSDMIAANTARAFVWDTTQSLWYRQA